MNVVFNITPLLQNDILKGESGSGIFLLIAIIVVLYLLSKNSANNSKRKDEVLSCHYCRRSVKRGNLDRGQCPFCGNQVE